MKLNRAVHQKDGTTIIFLQRRSGEILECFIDTADYGLVEQHSWSVLVNSRNTYSKTTVKGSGKGTTLLHSLLLPDAKLIDHRDGDGLNNRRSNLRPATHQQNSGNVRKIRRKTTSRYRGVSLHKCGRFLVQIRNGRERISVGLFVSEIDAARAYNRAASKIFGEFAKLNEFSSEDFHNNLQSFKTPEPASQPLPVSQIQLTLF
jgi:HNH endonuclease